MVNAPRTKTFKEVLAAFRANDSARAWDLVVRQIAGKYAMTLPRKLLTANAVPRRWGWRHPSAAQAFALTYYGDEMTANGGPDGSQLFSLIEDPRREHEVKCLDLDELRATLYLLQRLCRWNDCSRDPRHVRLLLGEIRARLKSREALTPT